MGAAAPAGPAAQRGGPGRLQEVCQPARVRVRRQGGWKARHALSLAAALSLPAAVCWLLQPLHHPAQAGPLRLHACLPPVV